MRRHLPAAAFVRTSVRNVATAVEHVRSTSVPGLPARPAIDMTVVVPTPAAVATPADRLGAIGYSHRGDLGVPGREAFTRPPDTPPATCTRA